MFDYHIFSLISDSQEDIFFSLDVESARIFKQKQLILSNIIIAFILTHS